MNRGLDRIQILSGGSVGIFDDLINFWEVSIENKKDIEKNSHLKS